MNYKKLIQKIHNKQLETFCTIKDFKNKKQPFVLPTKHRGLYWIWTDLTDSDLEKSTPKLNSKEVKISELVKHRKDLNNKCKILKGKFKIVYNGIGGYKKETKSSGLRERILQEIDCKSEGTGTLNIENRFKDNIDNWAISFFDFDDIENSKLIEEINYIDNAKDIEEIWRIEFGTPILNRH